MSHVLSASRSGHPSASASSSSAAAGHQHPYLPPMPSVRDTLSYDLAFAPFQQSCAAFLSSLDAYVLRGKEEIQARRVSHTATMKQAAEERDRLEKEIDSEGDKEGRLLRVLEKEKAEVHDLEQALAELKLSLGGVETQIRIGEGDAQEREAQIQTLQREKASREAALAQTRKAVAADLAEAELNLCIKIEGVKTDTLLIRFTDLYPSDPDKASSILLDLSASSYAVPGISPPIPTLSDILARLNQDRDFYEFLRRVRRAFREIALAEEDPTRARTTTF